MTRSRLICGSWRTEEFRKIHRVKSRLPREEALHWACSRKTKYGLDINTEVERWMDRRQGRERGGRERKRERVRKREREQTEN